MHFAGACLFRLVFSMALFITGQPLPVSVKQFKPLDEPVVVKLLTGARFPPQGRVSCVVRAEIVSDDVAPSTATASHKKMKNVVGLENSELSMEEDTRSVRFTELKFPTGTRLKAVRLRFATHLNVFDSHGNPHMLTLTSNASNPVVVKTNENQWFEAEGILLKEGAFGARQEISWNRLANWVHLRFIQATRQVRESHRPPHPARSAVHSHAEVQRSPHNPQGL